MKKILILLTILFIHSKGIGQTIPLELYELNTSYSDEFNSLNTVLWRTTHWDGNPWTQENTYFVNSCVSFANGIMKITPNVVNGIYKSGALISKNEFLYGYYETSVKMPLQHINAMSSWWNAGGCHNLFRPTAKYNEIDVFETGDAFKPMGAVLFGTEKNGCIDPISNDTGCHYETNYTSTAANPFEPLVSNLTNSFHTFGLEWTPDFVKIYFDGVLLKDINILGAAKPLFDVAKRPYGENTGLSLLTTPVNFIFWVKKNPEFYINHPVKINPDGTKSLEVDYFRYYKPKPMLTQVESNNTQLTLTSFSILPNETLTWTVSSGNLILLNQNLGTAHFNIPAGFSNATVTVSANSSINNAVSSTTYVINNSNGNFCSFSSSSNAPELYISNIINVPQAGCYSSIIPSGKNITLVGHQSVNLNSGFEVQLGAVFSAF